MYKQLILLLALSLVGAGGINYNNIMKITHRIAEIDYWSLGL